MGFGEWEAALHELQANLDSVRQALAEPLQDSFPTISWQLPTTLGPLPEALAKQAADLLAQLNETQSRLEIWRDTVGEELAEMAESASSGLPRRINNATADVPEPRLVDHSA